MNRLLYACFFSFLMAGGSHASLDSDLGEFFDNLGFTTNVTSPSAYQNQAAGYYSGGSLYARTPVRTIQPVSIQLPRISAGCNGADIFLGGFSFISADELVQSFKNIGSNAAGFAFKLGIKTLTPSVDEVITTLQDFANKVNTFSQSSCQAAKFLVNRAYAATIGSDQEGCINDLVDKGTASDAVEARNMCKQQGVADATNADTETNGTEQEKKDLWYQYNLTWRVLGDVFPFSFDPQLSRTLMSSVGSLIKRRNGNATEVIPVPPLESFSKVWPVLARGGRIAQYSCLDNEDRLSGCLNLGVEAVDIDPSAGIVTRVRDLLQGILDRIENRERLSGTQQRLVGNVRIPVYKILTVYHAYNRFMARSMVDDLAETIAVDYIDEYLDSMMRALRTATVSAKIAKENQDKMEVMLANAQRALSKVSAEKKRSNDEAYRLIMATSEIEMKLTSRAAGLIYK